VALHTLRFGEHRLQRLDDLPLLGTGIERVDFAAAHKAATARARARKRRVRLE